MLEKNPLRPIVTPPTFKRMQVFHRQLQLLANDSQYEFIYCSGKHFKPKTPYLEKGYLPLTHSGWNVTTGHICFIFYVAAPKSKPHARQKQSDENKKRFAELRSYTKQIESSFGQRILWPEYTSPKTGLYQAGIMVDLSSSEIATDSNESHWSAIQEELLSTAKKLNDVILPYLKRIQQNEIAQINDDNSAYNKPNKQLGFSQKQAKDKLHPKTSKKPTAAKANTLLGDKLYQQRAHLALPILVRQAKAKQTIYYSDLAEELQMPNPRNLNYVLGSVGKSLLELDKTIPPIQCLVVNRHTKLPSSGVGWFIDKIKFAKMAKKDKLRKVQEIQQDIYTYANWDRVLNKLKLTPVPCDIVDIIEQARKEQYGSGGEGPEHNALKTFVAITPSIIGLPSNSISGEIEYKLPSGDKLDILFKTNKEWVAVEIKSHISKDDDIVRGLFQCIKYQAVLEAYFKSESRNQNARTILVVGGQFPESLIPLRNVLGIETKVIRKAVYT